MKIILISIMVLVSNFAMAASQNTQTITCSFTEPFFSLTYNMEEASIAKTEPSWEDPSGELKTTLLGSDLDLVSTSNDVLLPTFEVKVPSEGRVLKLAMNFNGSDGMSNETYPIAAKWVDAEGYTLYGGCVTDQIGSVSTEEPVIEEPGIQ